VRPLTTCELVSKDVIPSVRAAVAVALIQKGLTEYRVSKLLGITPAAVSQYLSKKRGGKLRDLLLSKLEYRRRIEYIADLFIQDNGQGLLEFKISREVCHLCLHLRHNSDVKVAWSQNSI